MTVRVAVAGSHDGQGREAVGEVHQRDVETGERTVVRQSQHADVPASNPEIVVELQGPSGIFQGE
jgi:hypothetical protein